MQNNMESKSNDEDLLLIDELTEKKMEIKNNMESDSKDIDLLLINELTEKKLEFENKESQTGDKWVYLKNLRCRIKTFPIGTLFQWFALVMITFDNLFKNKRCTQCNEFKLLDDYYTARHASDNCFSACCDCVKKRSNFVNDLKSAIMRFNLEGKCCVDCGESNTLVLENDHVLDNKYITKTGRRTSGLMDTPLAKLCDMLLTCETACTRCHYIRTATHRSIDTKELSQHPRAIKGRKEYAERRKLINDEKIRIGRCQGCGFWDPNHLGIFHFNHLDPSTKVQGIMQMLIKKAPKKDIIEEMAKCNLLCGNCHKIVTADQAGWRSLEDFPVEILLEAKQRMDKAIEKKKNADSKKKKNKVGKRKIKNVDDKTLPKKQKLEEEKE